MGFYLCGTKRWRNENRSVQLLSYPQCIGSGGIAACYTYPYPQTVLIDNTEPEAVAGRYSLRHCSFRGNRAAAMGIGLYDPGKGWFHYSNVYHPGSDIRPLSEEKAACYGRHWSNPGGIRTVSAQRWYGYLLVKGEGVQANNIFFGSTISNDGFAGETFDFMLSNPPFGTPWKTDLKAWAFMISSFQRFTESVRPR